jgi:nicotinamide-nucleotide amidase
MNVEVVAIGTELLLGQIVDTNSSWIGEQLAAAGLSSHYQTKVGDNPERIRTVLQQAVDRSDAVICCGGLGPTQDDITREIIAEVMGVELVLDPGIEAKIRAMFESRGRVMPENNVRQAMIPVGATVIPEQPGTAPGLICPVGDDSTVGSVIYAVPGVPYEMKQMVEGTIIPDLRRRSGNPGVIRSRVLRTWGTSESALAEILADRIAQLDGVGNLTLAFLASGVEGLKVRITASAADDAAVDALLDAEQAVLEPLIGHLVFGIDGDNMETVVINALIDAQLTLAVAESVTGGYVAGRLCAVPGASAAFRGGIVAYAPEVKFEVLGVPEGPVVTEDAAVAMAEGVRARLGADIGIATTGVAGPEEREGRPVGTVCLAVAAADGAIASTVRLPGDRERIRQFSTITLLDLLRRVLIQA